MSCAVTIPLIILPGCQRMLARARLLLQGCVLSMALMFSVTAAFAATVSISANPASVSSGGSSTLTWSSTGATSCAASGDWSGLKATSGSQSVLPVQASAFTLICSGPSGNTTSSASGTASVSVSGLPNVPPTITLTAPTFGATFTAPASITLTASAADSDGTIVKVEFYRDTTLVGTVNAPPFTLQDANVPAATYSYTAKAYDNGGAITTSSAVSVTVNQDLGIYYIHADHLGTPRAITRPSDNALVWEWKNSEPFGNNLPNQEPSGLGNFDRPHGFPGQYYDVETGTYYNYFRDCYDPLTGRYCQSDPVGLAGGLSTYSYVEGDPLGFLDDDGLQKRAAAEPYGNQIYATTSANILISQIQQYQPNFRYDVISGPGRMQWTRSNIRDLQQTLLSLRQKNLPSPNFVVTATQCIPVPTGSGLVPVINSGGRITGQAFSGGTGGGNNLPPNVSQLRLMEPTVEYPNGYAVFMNSQNQGVNPFTGQTLPNSSPLRHIPLK